jgi:hypothetical protein
VLRWYPPGWRDRYGEELVVLMEDTLGDRPPTVAFRLSMVRAGLAERVRHGGGAGDRVSRAERARAGALVVLAAWTAFVLAGSALAKEAEHFDEALPATSGPLATTAFAMVEVFAAVAGTAVVTGAAAAVPAFIWFLRGGGWPTVRRGLVAAAVATVAATVATAGLALAAVRLPATGPGADAWPYRVAFVGWYIVVAAALAAWTALAVRAARRVLLSRTVLAVEGALAVLVAGAMTTMATATGLWWRAMAADAPWFFRGLAPGTNTSAADPRMLVIMALMVGSAVIAAHGAVRVGRSWPRRPDPDQSARRA